MEKVLLGRTGITAAAYGFGALPIQRISLDEAVVLLRRALAGGIDFYDTARFYSDSEEKLGAAFEHDRERIYLASKSMALKGEQLEAELAVSLKNLRTDHLDLYQFHNPPFCPKPGDGSGLYEAALKVKAAGKIRHIGITSHSLAIADEAIESGLFETLQFPFSYLSGDKDVALVDRCLAAGMGFIAMKGLSGGLITNAAAAAAFMGSRPGVLPIWGIQRISELDEFLALAANLPRLDAAMQSVIERDRRELGGEFCRSCGYCMPCPAKIVILNCARMSFNIRRMPSDRWTTPEWQAEMKKINDCRHCGRCVKRCPYHLDVPALLRRNYEDYKAILAGRVDPASPLNAKNGNF